MTQQEILEGNKLIAFIYRIENLINGKCYIGSTTKFNKRKKRHIEDLNKGNHHSKPLQRAFNKYGRINFEIVMMEQFPFYTKQDILDKEQNYINQYSPEYNVCRIAGSQLGSKRDEEFKRKCAERMKGKPSWNKGLKTGPQSEETKTKRANSLRGQKRTPEYKRFMSEKMKGRKPSEETKQKMSKAKIKHGKYCRK